LNGAAFLLTWVTRIVPMERLALMPILFPRQPWTIITYMFLHAGFMHLFFNMLALFIFGPRLEARLGSRQFLWLYFVSGMVGGLLSFPATPRSWIVGASGAVFGIMYGFARYWPHEKIYIWAILPISAWAWVVIMAVLSLSMGLRGTGSVAHFAHLGGFLGGFLYLFWWDHRSPAAQFRKKAAMPAARRSGAEADEVKHWSTISRDEMHPVNREELDRILDKISADGMGSLSTDERAFLARFSTLH
jgi:membrane associated rhomboid family serine protease